MSRISSAARIRANGFSGAPQGRRLPAVQAGGELPRVSFPAQLVAAVLIVFMVCMAGCHGPKYRRARAEHDAQVGFVVRKHQQWEKEAEKNLADLHVQHEHSEAEHRKQLKATLIMSDHRHRAYVERWKAKDPITFWWLRTVSASDREAMMMYWTRTAY